LTVAVVEEVGAEGPLTDVIVGVTILKDILVIVLFSVTLGFVEMVLSPGPGGGGHVGAEAVRGVGGALLIGAFLGWVFSKYLEAGHTPRSPVSVFLLSFVMVVIAEQFHLELLLMAVAAGFTIENASAAGDRLIRAVRSVAIVIFALFFAIAGASLDLGAIRGFWLAALIVFTARLILTGGGAILGSHMASAGRTIRSGTWKGLISQGGGLAQSPRLGRALDSRDRRGSGSAWDGGGHR
jgi:Kef-type K+ transport system membrane component KefB